MAEHKTTLREDDDPLSKRSLPAWLLQLFPLFGFLCGLLMWLVDALIDVYFIHPGEALAEALLAEEPTEMWMRSLVVLVMTVSAFVAQRLLKRQYLVEQLLRNYQLHLEQLVEERTQELEDMANLDPLTRIYNRRKFTEVLDYEIQRSKRYHQPLSLIMCDIDHFKRINDQYGHQVGDEALIKIANGLSSCLRSADSYARWGGEEFIILLPHTDLNEAKSVAENLRQCIARLQTDQGFQLTASFGISSFHEDEEVSPLVKRADDALYQAKHAGRNRISIFE